MATSSDDYKDPPKDDPRPEEPAADSDQDTRPENANQRAELGDTFAHEKAPSPRPTRIGGGRRPQPGSGSGQKRGSQVEER
ncbi:hypothetical protein [Hymenobacter radiodurans]|uniref:hypothetical protein n=1 Tax=Hymenobacter radiodurans TaxID=2496028 RepID=UPI0010588800|nr:hypothetical protein [Hymenobacter radiodurans]